MINSKVKPQGVLNFGIKRYLGEELLSLFESVYYVKAEHKNRFSGDYNNDSLLVFIKK